jgi:AcrR family transcriptional regulator
MKATGKTRDSILQTALELFNTRGTDAVSTNHIAEAAGISPGNLYYHFRNKGEIIRALFEQLFAETDRAFAVPMDRMFTLEDVRGMVRINFEIIGGYRFAYREILPLLRADADLRARYLAVRQRGYEGFREIFAALEHAGMLTMPDDEQAIDQLADLCWLISEFWLSTVEVSGHEVDAAQMQRGLDLMTRVLHPYIPKLT